jgi:polyhydroxybutyrate depolymerase
MLQTQVMRSVRRSRLGVLSCAACLLATAGTAQAELRAPCDLPIAAGEHTVALSDQGEDRPFLLYVPEGYDGARKLPLVLNLHGSRGNGSEQMGDSQMAEAADERDVIVAAPNGGVRGQNATSFFWNVPGVPLVDGTPVPEGSPNDQRYLMAVIKKAQQKACINRNRVHFTGYSGGARMSSQMACDYSNKIAAVAPVAGLRAGIPRQNEAGVWKPGDESCRPERPVPVLTFHGTADTVNPYAGNDEPRWGYSVKSALGRWAKLNRCRLGPTTKLFAPRVSIIKYRKCQGGGDVQLYEIDGGGHSWPGDGTIDATGAMLEFFSEHPLPRR